MQGAHHGGEKEQVRTFLSSHCAIHAHTRTHKVAKTSQFLRRSLTGRPSRLQLTSSSWLSSMALTDHWVQGLSTWEGGGGGGLGPPRGRSRTFHSPSYRYGFPPLIFSLGGWETRSPAALTRLLRYGRRRNAPDSSLHSLHYQPLVSKPPDTYNI